MIRPEDLERKFRTELHANELVLLAYYVAAVNIEETYHGLIGGADYEPFPGIILTDTFQSSEDDDRYDDQGIFGDNNERVKAQNALDIRVIVGNPPYSAGQTSADDDNQNLKYPFLDARITETYALRSKAALKNKLYDSYVRAVRWATDRIKDRGVVAFVSNGGFLESNSFDGVRLSLADEFSALYVFNLRGNGRTSGEQRRKERDGVFGEGSRATVAISILVKNPEAAENGKIYYHDIGDYLSRAQKLEIIDGFGGIAEVPWDEIAPNEAGDWLAQRNEEFMRFIPLGDRVAGGTRFFDRYSLGAVTSRDAWLYNSSRHALMDSVRKTIDFFNEQSRTRNGASWSDKPEMDPARISWSAGLIARAKRGDTSVFDENNIVEAIYRPFQKQYLYADPAFIERPGALSRLYPFKDATNVGIYVVGMGSAVPFSAIAINAVPDLHVTGAGSGGQVFARFTYEPRTAEGELDIYGEDIPFRRIDNITDEILSSYREMYGAEVTKDDIFNFVYGLLHSPGYRLEYASDLTKIIPRLPPLGTPSDFRLFAEAGRKLMVLHLGYESVEPYPLLEERSPGASPRVERMRFAGKAGAWDKSTIRYNDQITLRGIPLEADDYKVGSRSALEWILERYRVRLDPDSSITNDPNAWGLEHGDPEYILDLLKRIVTVSVESVALIKGLPDLDIRV